MRTDYLTAALLLMHYINIHTHIPTHAPAVTEIESVWYGQDKLPTAALLSVGLHPWYLEGIDLQAAAHWLRTQAARPEVIAIGEAGLDKVTSTPWDLQIQAFTLCIQIARDTGKPLVIHCVRAYNEVLRCLQAEPPVRSVFHGFDKNKTVAELLLRQGCYLSFGAALFREQSHAASVLQQIPADRFVLETDDASVSITAVYERAAAIRGVTAAALGDQVAANAAFLLGLQILPPSAQYTPI